MCRALVHVFPGNTPFILSDKDIDDLGFNYETKYKIIERPYPMGIPSLWRCRVVCHI